MPKRTYKQIAEFHDITRDQVDAAKNKGVNIHSDVEMKRHLKDIRHRIKPGTELPPEMGEAQSLEEMEQAIRRATNIDEVKILKEKVLALKGIVAVQVEIGEYIPKGQARESTTRIVSAARGELLKLVADLPPRLAGLSEAPAQKILREEIINVLTRLSDETSKLYR